MVNDKCDLCALKVVFDQDEVGKARRIEDIFKAKSELQEKGALAKGYNRRIFTSVGTDGSGDKSEMCAINSPLFLKENKDKKCPDFIFNMGLSVPEALSLNASQKSIKLSFQMNRLTWVLVVLTIVLLFLGIFSFIQNIPDPSRNPIRTEQAINENAELTKQQGKVTDLPKFQNERH